MSVLRSINLSNAAISKLVAISQNARDQVGSLGPKAGLSTANGVDVLIVSFGKNTVALDYRLQILGECWRAGISAEILLEESETTAESLQAALSKGKLL